MTKSVSMVAARAAPLALEGVSCHLEVATTEAPNWSEACKSFHKRTHPLNASTATLLRTCHCILHVHRSHAFIQDCALPPPPPPTQSAHGSSITLLSMRFFNAHGSGADHVGRGTIAMRRMGRLPWSAAATYTFSRLSQASTAS